MKLVEETFRKTLHDFEYSVLRYEKAIRDKDKDSMKDTLERTLYLCEALRLAIIELHRACELEVIGKDRATGKEIEQLVDEIMEETENRCFGIDIKGACRYFGENITPKGKEKVDQSEEFLRSARTALDYFLELLPKKRSKKVLLSRIKIVQLALEEVEKLADWSDKHHLIGEEFRENVVRAWMDAVKKCYPTYPSNLKAILTSLVRDFPK